MDATRRIKGYLVWENRCRDRTVSHFDQNGGVGEQKMLAESASNVTSWKKLGFVMSIKE